MSITMMTCNSLPFLVSDLVQTTFLEPRRRKILEINPDDIHLEKLGCNCPGIPRANGMEFGMIAYEYCT